MTMCKGRNLLMGAKITWRHLAKFFPYSFVWPWQCLTPTIFAMARFLRMRARLAS